MEKNFLEVDKLQTAFQTDKGEVISVEEVSFQLRPGETIGIVGESGCGKSVTSLSLMRLLGHSGVIKKGSITFNGRDLTKATEAEMRSIRGNEISMIFQEPMTSLNPVFTVGNQMLELINLHMKLPAKEARAYAVEMLTKVGIPRASEIIDEYPHKLSGGMRQRVMIAMALSCKPKLLIADEPTTALDVTIQAQILELMKKLRDESNTAIMIISHDLGVIAEMADKVIVMYAGQVVEEADVFTLFDDPKHPYTKGLMDSIPHLEHDSDQRLFSIPGTVPTIHNMPKGCRFHTRCQYATEKCAHEKPPLLPIQPESDHRVRCWLQQDDPHRAPIQPRTEVIA
ncbi:ABC transporter ATP-binding protein [Brevibacillus centrosporus]|uniref:Oligopeptide/dipeptide ABC transporter, ATP-binding protein, C-terminal domain-containing protein n=1 Tax=Brevibacillus centrosporus TaxID=54910 RepID=A0A1I3XAY7_9BACL|nr:ABC transporter ATP-binding protein [Brevibacillus centrosporus]MEC2133144.1 ABC transporter ATP-binding protein [Brevibacillus centrosporus]MED1949854.1 ABC transporter ATP-binding protein [Brevibacillus centrosporus]MED4911045.1 ABC transporter ATP-binding protein [Brevibacillus centrosporus]RNB64896.1 ABC transporter ATP-binding protein [Brevibacillus centrosporus]SFK16106.1 oligopeptide/dipeptide ABC transporter, ATP-binding protein, C-terminal domain-containing protein [Brevibacillus c